MVRTSGLWILSATLSLDLECNAVSTEPPHHPPFESRLKSDLVLSVCGCLSVKHMMPHQLSETCTLTPHHPPFESRLKTDLVLSVCGCLSVKHMPHQLSESCTLTRYALCPCSSVLSQSGQVFYIGDDICFVYNSQQSTKV